MSTMKPQSRRSPVGLVCLAAVAVVGALVVTLMIQRWRSGGGVSRDLEAVLAELDESDPKWRLEDLEAARADIPDAENSALVIAAIASRLPSYGPPFSGAWASEYQINERFDEARLADQRTIMAKGLALMEEARRLADLPRGRHAVQLDHTAPLRKLLRHHLQTSLMANLLQFDAIDRAHAGDIRGALHSCRAGINVARSIGDEPLYSSQEMRNSCFLQAANAVEHSLALGEADEKALAELQRLVAEETRHNWLLFAWRGQRAGIHTLLSGLADRSVKLRDLPDEGAGGSLRTRLSWGGRQLARAEHAELLRLATRAVENVRLPWHEQAEGERELSREVDPRTGKVRLAEVLLPVTYEIAHWDRRKVVTAPCLMALLAVERYRLKHGKWPGSLDELKPDLLEEVPLDPFDGKPLRYKRLPEGVVVYSVGSDGKDDGGDTPRGLSRRYGLGPDLGCRLWDVAKRNQPARPVLKKPKK